MVSVGLLSVGDHGEEQEGTGKEELEIFKGDLHSPRWGPGVTGEQPLGITGHRGRGCSKSEVLEASVC